MTASVDDGPLKLQVQMVLVLLDNDSIGAFCRSGVAHDMYNDRFINRQLPFVSFCFPWSRSGSLLADWRRKRSAAVPGLCSGKRSCSRNISFVSKKARIARADIAGEQLLRLQEIHVAHELSRWRVNITSIFSDSPTFSSTWLLLLPPPSFS